MFLMQSDTSEVGQSSIQTPRAQVPVKSEDQTPVQVPDQDKKVTIVNGQMVIRSTQASGDESIVIRPTTAGTGVRAKEQGVGPGKQESPAPGSTAPRSSPTHSSMQEQLRFQQSEALKR